MFRQFFQLALVTITLYITTNTREFFNFFIVCKQTGFVNQMLGDFVKMTPTRVTDSDSKNRDSSHAITSAQ